jgi:D-xylose transport system substrate-binding protein
MRRSMILATAAAAAAGLLLAGCSSNNSSSGSTGSGTGGSTGGGKAPFVGVILPDTKSSVRWETADRPYLQKAFDAAGVKADIQNAQGDKTQFQTIADQMITEGVNVLMIVNLDSGSGSAVLQKAKAQGIGTIDYDRLTLGGGADYYVSFDNTKVGELQGQGLAKCLQDKGKTAANIVYLDGSPTDNNATLFAAGAHKILDPMTQYKKVAEQAVPDWDNQQAGTIFEQMWTQQGGKIDGVLAANDGLGNAAIAILQKNGVAGQVPVTGQDATDQGLQNILAGTQCMTVYKAVKKEADAASQLAIDLAKGKDASSVATATVKDTQTNKDVKAVLLTPEAITAPTVKDVIADGYTTKDKICTAALADACAKNGIS